MVHAPRPHAPQPHGPRLIYWWASICCVLVLAVGALTTALLASRAADHSTHAVQGSCQFYRDLAAVPIAPTSTKALLTIIADARVAYDTADCPLIKGKLPPADARVKPLLPPGLR